MKLIESKAEYLSQSEGLEGCYKHIELCGRTAYKSEDKITDESAEPFVTRMINSNHGAVLEHGTVYLEFLYEQPIKVTHQDGTSIVYDDTEIYNNLVNKYTKNSYSRAIERYVGQGAYCVYITTNLRVLVENDWMDDLKFLCELTEHHKRRYSVKLTCSRGISHELVRHRKFSFIQESQRYCNYSKDKFGNEITFIKPSWYSKCLSDTVNYIHFYDACEYCEMRYFQLLEGGCTPQEAREVLPNATKTEIIMTGFEDDWKHFFDLRLYGTTGKPHPDMVILAQKIKDEFTKNGINVDD